MPTFKYTARSLKGEVKSGTMQAASERELAHILHQEGYILVSAESPEKQKRFKISISLPFRRVSLTDKLMLTRNLKVMVSAGVSIPRALNVLSQQFKNQKLKSALGKIGNSVTKGQSFSEALAEYPDIFSEVFVSMVKIGEESGTLEEVLTSLSQYIEREHELRSKIMGALMYPAIVILAMIGVGILMLTVVVPQLASIFKELGVDLPITTRIVISLGLFLSKFWYLLPLLVLVFIFIARYLLSTPTGRKVKDTLFLHTPLIGVIVKKSNTASTIRTLASLMSAGVPFVQALEIISRSSGNEYFKNAFAKAAERTKKGEKLSEVLVDYQYLFSPTVIQMLKVGEETGQTADILKKLSEFYEEEVTNATKNLASVIEPILMLIIGSVVGFFAVSMIQPMYSMIQSLD